MDVSAESNFVGQSLISGDLKLSVFKVKFYDSECLLVDAYLLFLLRYKESMSLCPLLKHKLLPVYLSYKVNYICI